MNVPDVSGDDSLSFLPEPWIACHLYGNTRVIGWKRKKKSRTMTNKTFPISIILGIFSANTANTIADEGQLGKSS